MVPAPLVTIASFVGGGLATTTAEGGAKSLASSSLVIVAAYALLEAMLRRPNGATIEQISKSLAWQAHSVRGAISGTLKKKQGLTITNEKTDDGRRLYRIA
jgi:hypothetical protein